MNNNNNKNLCLHRLYILMGRKQTEKYKWGKSAVVEGGAIRVGKGVVCVSVCMFVSVCARTTCMIYTGWLRQGSLIRGHLSKVLKEARDEALGMDICRKSISNKCKDLDGHCALHRLGTTKKPVQQKSNEQGEQGSGDGNAVGRGQEGH